jgi:hypothetical protein
MNERFSADALLELVHRFHPAGLHADDPRYEASEQSHRMKAARQAAREEEAAWKGFLQRVREELPGSSLWDLSGPRELYDPSRRVRVYLPEGPVTRGKHQAIVVGVSILAPVHLLYASRELTVNEEKTSSQVWFPPLPPEFRAYEDRLDGLVRDSFNSVRLPNEVLFTPVPDLQVGNTDLGKAQLLHCLFTDDVW